MNRYGAVAGMIAGLAFTAGYIVWFHYVDEESNTAEHWLFGISTVGIGTIGMAINFAVALAVCRFTPPPSPEVRRLIDRIRVPRGFDEVDDRPGIGRGSDGGSRS